MHMGRWCALFSGVLLHSTLALAPRGRASRRRVAARAYGDAALDEQVRRALAMLEVEAPQDAPPQDPPPPARQDARRPQRLAPAAPDVYAHRVNWGSRDEGAAYDDGLARSEADVVDLVLRAARGLEPKEAWAAPGAPHLDAADPKSRAAFATLYLVDAARSAAAGGHVLVELGAREADVSHAVADVSQIVPRGGFERVVLVDRAEPTAQIRQRDATLDLGRDAVQRLVVGIQHLNLDAIEREIGLVVVAKHICGPACDYALRAAALTSCALLVLAPCCYWEADYASYPNKAFLAGLGFVNQRDFKLLAATTASRPGSRSALVGQHAMDILDAGRADFLRQRGYDATVVSYAPPHLAPDGSLETNLIVARPRG